MMKIKIKKEKKQNLTPSLTSNVVISYRLEGKESLGKGAFYDHYTLQHHTGHQTSVAHADNVKIKMTPLKEDSRSQTNSLPHSEIDPNTNKPLPKETHHPTREGLLVLPGMTRESYEGHAETHKIRMKYENTLIKMALNTGQPILAICAGSWTLWNALGGELVSVADHNYGGGMPRIGAQGTMTYNVHIHDVVIEPNTLVNSAIQLKNKTSLQTIPVNSIHWMAPSAEIIPQNFEIAATSKKNDAVVLKTRQNNIMNPDEDTIEAFSSIFGAPIIGFVWHPEAFDWNSNSNEAQSNSRALLFMAKAGDAYKARCEMIDEFKNKVHAVINDETEDDLVSVFNKLKI
jgi:gamma-glutamyl-gamma-aminobutyrate hydrolase PuuD